MSLKAFHVFFVTVSVLLMVLLGGWSVGNYRADGAPIDLVWAGAAFLTAGVLLVYGRFFIRKFKNISYL